MTTIDGIEIEITDPDALFARAELIMQATDEVLTKQQHAAQSEGTG